MDIYFAGSIRGGREDVDLYAQLITHLGNYGRVLTEHVGCATVGSSGEIQLDESEIHDRDMTWLEKSKIVVAEVTQVSLGVGYEIGRIVERNQHVPESERKRVLCLYRPQQGKRLSAMIMGCKELDVRDYNNISEAREIINNFFSS